MNHFRLAKGKSFELLDLISLINKRGKQRLCVFAIDKTLLPGYIAD